MQKLTKMKVKDVLSHEDTTAAIAPCVTVFTGRSDSGKSVMMRALLWACENKPNGINLLRHGAKRGAYAECEVVGVDDDGADFSVVRRRSKSSNEYVFNGTDLKAFGTETPECIKRSLNLSTNWVRSQQDGQFLLSDSDGEVARVLGQTVGLSKIDKAFGDVRERKSANDADLRAAKLDVERETTELAQFEGLNVASEAVSALEKQEQAISEFAEKVNSANTCLHELVGIPSTDKIGEAKRLIKEVGELSSAVIIKNNSCVLAKEMVDGLSAIPEPIETNNATLLVKEYEDLKLHGQSVLARHSDVARDLDVLSGIPEHVDTSKCGAALANVKVDLGKKQKLEVRLGELETCLREISAIPLNVFTTHIHPMLAHVNNLLKAKTEMVETVNILKGLVEKLTACAKESSSIITTRNAVKKQIEDYLQNNPTCRECGAEQRNWINK